jgi:hypothetical protein
LRRSACNNLLPIASDCIDPIFHKYCDCYPWSNPLQLDWLPENSSFTTQSVSPSKLNLTEHNTTQFFLDGKQNDEHHCNGESAQLIASQPQEITTANPALLHLWDKIPTSPLTPTTSSPTHLHGAGEGQVTGLTRYKYTIVKSPYQLNSH